MTVHNVLLLDKDGTSLLDITVGNLSLDPILMSGFFAAIVYFAKELTKSDSDVITDLGLLNNRAYFIYDFPLIGVIVVDHEDEKEEVVEVMKNILSEFKTQFDLGNWDRNTYTFEQFRYFMKNKIKSQFQQIKRKIFQTAQQIFSKYKHLGCEAEWDLLISQFQQEFDPRLMIVAGSVFEYMGSKVLREKNGSNHKYTGQNQVITTNTFLNIWDPDLFNVYHDALKFLEGIDSEFSEKYA